MPSNLPDDGEGDHPFTVRVFCHSLADTLGETTSSANMVPIGISIGNNRGGEPAVGASRFHLTFQAVVRE